MPVASRGLVIDGCQFGPIPSEGPPLGGADVVFYTVHGATFRDAAIEMARVHERSRVVRRVSELGGGSPGVVLAFQDPAPIENQLPLLRAFYALGLRVVQLTYNKANYLGTGCAERVDRGLTDFGRDVVRAMNELGMLIDLSHCSRRTALEAIELSEHPVVFSHACTHALAPNPRNRTDEELAALATSGGVMGVTPWGPICWKRERDEPPSLDDYLDHVERVVAVAGEDHVGFGTDQTVDGSSDEEGIGIQGDLYPQVVGEYDRRVGTNPSVRYTRGFRDTTELPNVVEGLATRGLGQTAVWKFLGGNFRRVLERVWRE